MFTKVDDLLFPNKVEVYDYHEIGKFFYPIFKCGSTTLREIARDRGFKTIINDQIKSIAEIDIFLRDPKERYISGVKSYLYWLVKNNPTVDLDTVKFYLDQGFIFDRHFAHQFQWIINLARYITPTTKLHFHGMGMLNEYCKHINLPADKYEDYDVGDLVNNSNLEFSFRLDQLMLNELVGQSWTVGQVMTHLMTRDPTAYFSVIGKTQHIAEVSHVLPKV